MWPGKKVNSDNHPIDHGIEIISQMRIGDFQIMDRFQTAVVLIYLGNGVFPCVGKTPDEIVQDLERQLPWLNQEEKSIKDVWSGYKKALKKSLEKAFLENQVLIR